VWIVLWSCVDARSGLARVSYRALAEKTGLGARQVFRLVHELTALGFLEVDSRGGPKKWTVNSYRVHPRPRP
jgi:DNA-binding IclR family transcriptional regulator